MSDQFVLDCVRELKAIKDTLLRLETAVVQLTLRNPPVTFTFTPPPVQPGGARIWWCTVCQKYNCGVLHSGTTQLLGARCVWCGEYNCQKTHMTCVNRSAAENEQP